MRRSHKSISRRKIIPPQNPIRAGRKEGTARLSACSIAGRRRLHTEAAVITPAANPARARRTPSRSFVFRKNTHAAPSVVPRKGIRIPGIVSFIRVFLDPRLPNRSRNANIFCRAESDPFLLSSLIAVYSVERKSVQSSSARLFSNNIKRHLFRPGKDVFLFVRQQDAIERILSL